MASRHPILIVAGVGNGSGTGAATAKVFAKAGYRVALMSRNAEHLKKTSEIIKGTGGDAAPFPVAVYDHSNMNAAFSAVKQYWPNDDLRAAVWNVGVPVFKGFLDITEEDIRQTVDTSIVGAFAFAREAILAFKDLPLNEQGKRGSLIFTGATAALRGNQLTSAIAAGKFGTRALSQSLNKEFGKQNIHVAHSIIDGGILTDMTRGHRKDAKWEDDRDIRLEPESIAKSYLYLANQDRSAWTWELDLRPAHESW